MSEEQKQERTCTCLFCGKSFPVSQIKFYYSLRGYNKRDDDMLITTLEKYNMGQELIDWAGDDEKSVLRLSRCEVDWHCEGAQVVRYEEGTDNQIPLEVRGSLKGLDVDSPFFSGFMDFFSGDDNEDDNDAQKTKLIMRSSQTRVCPECGMTLPKGFATDRVIHLGLVGGTRSGKTTYMAVASKYMMNRLGSSDKGVNLGNAQLTPESEAYVDMLNNRGVDATKIDVEDDTTDNETGDKPVLPVVMRIVPLDKENYQPFILVLQDIPGEYLLSVNKELLSGSNIKSSTDIAMFVDVNHFVNTPQKEDSAKYGECCDVEVNKLFDNYEKLGDAIKESELNSIQIVITKTDFWVESDERISKAVFSISGDEQHNEAISQRRLSQVSAQVSTALGQLQNGSNYSGLIDQMKQTLGVPAKHTAYSAVASKTVPSHEDKFSNPGSIDPSLSLNVMEPLFNIFASYGILPVKKEDVIRVK